ncbi:MAG: hypothetical protein QY323_02360 [Patescibacteria group bacterium]|nr:MAG: hypothetical protein QY323_02360 [Patescibacteria group bacterium]
MAEFSQWWRAFAQRLDGERERRIIGFGAMGLLLFLSVGPTVLDAAASTAALFPKKRPEPLPAAAQQIIMPPSRDEAPAVVVAEPTETPSVTPENVAPAVAPPLTILFPNAGAEVQSPVAFALRLENASAVAMLVEINDASGLRVGTSLAAPTPTGDWSALFTAEPGTYVASVRASLIDGSVVSFKEQRAFRVLAPEPSIAPADPSDPSAEILAPDNANGAYDGIAPLAARVKNAQPNTVVFVVTASDGSETLVLGTEVGTSGYWTAIFEGPDDDYRAHARATIGERSIFSAENTFTLRASDH